LRAEFAVGNLAERREVLRTMEALFTQLTGKHARRAGGRLYTDRLIVNEEASSPFRVRVGRKAAARLAATVSPILDFCADYGAQVQEKFSRSVADALEAGETTLSFHRYASRLRSLSPSLPPVRPVRLGPDGRLDLCTDLAAAADGGPRFALPDICLARGAEGAIRPILSSMHHQLLTAGWLFTFYPNVSRVEREAADWIRAHAPWPLVELATGRHNKGYYSFPGARAAHSPAELARGQGEGVVFPASELRVKVEGGRPTLCGPSGDRIELYLPLADLTLHAPFTALSAPPVVFAPIATGAAHTPRLDVDGATYQRERWALPTAGWKSLSGWSLFRAMQRLRDRLGLPRFVFARVPGERKPFLVDVMCPFALDLLKHLARDTDTVAVEEMLPSPDELWLRDERGRYTFELRIQAKRSAGRASRHVASALPTPTLAATFHAKARGER
jgi:hypothetical protein